MAALPLAGQAGHAYVYGVDGAARVRFVRAARAVQTDGEGIARLIARDFDPDREIVAPRRRRRGAASDGRRKPVGESPSEHAGRAAIVHEEDSSELVIDADAPQDGFLLLADTFYPGWGAQVDGRLAPIYRANVMLPRHPDPEGITTRCGSHSIRRVSITGLQITMLSLSLLVCAWCRDARPTRSGATSGSADAKSERTPEPITTKNSACATRM